MTKIQAIEHAIHEANLFRSKLSPEALAVPGFTSLKIRHLMNNLGAISNNFAEIGSHVGGTFCSALFQNENLEFATSLDNFSEFNEDSPLQQLLNNVGKFKCGNTQFKLINQNCWETSPDSFPQGIDLYMFDGPHGKEEQRRAVTEWLPAMADEFIFLVDDYNGIENVKEGTQEGITLAKFRYNIKTEHPGFKVLFEQELYDGNPGNNMSFHNGIYLALCSKV